MSFNQIVCQHYSKDGNIQISLKDIYFTDWTECEEAFDRLTKNTGYFCKKSSTICELYADPTQHWIMKYEIFAVDWTGYYTKQRKGVSKLRDSLNDIVELMKNCNDICI